MEVCKNIKEFIEEFINNECNFLNVAFEEKSLYRELLIYCEKYPNDKILTLIIANLYYFGLGCEKNAEKSVYWCKKSAELGNHFSICYLGVCHLFGKGVIQNYSLAFECFKKAAETNNILAMVYLGNCYEDGMGCVKSLIDALYWYEKAANSNNIEGMFYLAEMYGKGKGIEVDLVKAFNWYKKSAENGQCKSMSRIAYYYECGISCEKNMEEAIKWYLKAANCGEVYAMNNLGSIYEKGKGVEVDLEKAFKFYYNSAKKGCECGMVSLARCYNLGIGCDINEIEAYNWNKKAAILGNDKGMCYLGVFHLLGVGCEVDKDLAFYWFKMSAEKGNSQAMAYLGECYEKGSGCEINPKLAFYWVKKSVSLNPSYAMTILAKYYETGFGCEVDLKEAVTLLKNVVDLGYEKERENYERVNELLVQEQYKKEKLHCSKRKDVFISWNHLDDHIKESIFNYFESRNIFTVWESDGNGVGDIKTCLKEVITLARSYIIILTGNSIKSKWVEQEVSLILEKVKSNPDYSNVIRPIIINKVKQNGVDIAIDVIEEIKNFDDNSPFKELLNYCASFEDLEEGIDFDKIFNTIKEALSNNIIIEYRYKLLNQFNRFSAALNSVVASRQSATGIIGATLEFEQGYLNRDIIDENGNSYNTSELFNNITPSLIYGEGGSGKSLYLKNFIRKEFNKKRYIFFIECKEIVELIKSYDFIKILKIKSFDNYFTEDEASFVTQNAFENFILAKNKIVLLVDALDELLLEQRNMLICKIREFMVMVPNCKIIFTSRNKTDSCIINSKLHTEVNVYELKGLSLKEIEKLYDNLSSKYKYKINAIKESISNTALPSIIETNKIISKELFFKQLEDIDEEIKKNPLLISNLIFIYFSTNRLPNSSFDIINEAVIILLNDLEEERNIRFEYMDYIINDNLYKLLGYFSLCRAYQDVRPADVLIQEYLELNYNENVNYAKIAEEIYKYLRGRAVIVNENISHEIFKNYFVAMYIFNAVYELTVKRPVMKKYYRFSDDGYDALGIWCDEYFSNNNQTWNNIAVDLLYKLDFEIYNLDTKKEMNEKHLSYQTFNQTLIKVIKEEGFNIEIIKAITKLINNKSLHYTEFVKKYV